MIERKKMRLALSGILVLAVLSGLMVYPYSLGFLDRWFNQELKLGLDLRGGAQLLYQADMSEISSGDRQDAIDAARDVIERRVNVFGVSEAVVQTNVAGENYRILVELPGVTDIDAAIAQIGSTPQLEFREPDIRRSLAEARDLMEEAQADLQSGASFVEVADARTEDPSNAFGDEKKGGDLGFLRREQLDITFADAAWELADGEITTEPVETMYGLHLIQRTESRIVTDKNSAGEDEQIEEVRVRHLLIRTRPTTADPFIYLANFKQTGLTGKQLRKAVVVFDQITGEPQVSVQFNSEGTELFAQITERNIGDEVGIFLDGSPVSIPVVNQEISSGEAVISGSFTVAEAKQLVRDLNAGALPVPVSLVNQQQVGATLGDEAVQKSVFAGLIGVVAVIIFMIMWYRLPGVVASLALVLYALVVLAIYILWPVTLTLSGIAGFLLSVGMAVDANILIFERMKEELRGGRSLDMAVREGFARAWPSIRDSNVSSLITCALLLFIGTGLVKGFALTLAIGIVVSMFSAITATRYILYAVVRAKSRTWWFGVRSSSSS